MDYEYKSGKFAAKMKLKSATRNVIFDQYAGTAIINGRIYHLIEASPEAELMRQHGISRKEADHIVNESTKDHVRQLINETCYNLEKRVIQEKAYVSSEERDAETAFINAFESWLVGEQHFRGSRDYFGRYSEIPFDLKALSIWKERLKELQKHNETSEYLSRLSIQQKVRLLSELNELKKQIDTFDEKQLKEAHLKMHKLS